jgi:DNA-binding NtrC family response regulator
MVVDVHLPALREREADVLILAAWFIRSLAANMRKH